MLKTNKVIFIGGIHGVGKSTFAKAVKEECPSVEELSCSTILKWENPAHKEVVNVGENQNKLMANLPHFIEADKSYLLDGHFCLLTEKHAIERVPIEVFQTINPVMILLLEAEPKEIVRRLSLRDSKAYSEAVISEFIDAERLYAEEVAKALGIPLKICNPANWNSVVDEVSSYLQ